MAVDPVCKMEVDEKTCKYKSEYKGKTYYFCAPGCKMDFDDNPEKNHRLELVLLPVLVQWILKSYQGLELQWLIVWYYTQIGSSGIYFSLFIKSLLLLFVDMANQSCEIKVALKPSTETAITRLVCAKC